MCYLCALWILEDILGERGWYDTVLKRDWLVFQRGAGSEYDFSSCFYLSRVLFSSSRQFLVCFVRIEFGHDVVNSLVNVELFATEYVDEGRISVREGVNADMTFGDYHESTDSPLGRILVRPIDESVGRADLVHPDNIGQLIQ